MNGPMDGLTNGLFCNWLSCMTGEEGGGCKCSKKKGTSFLEMEIWLFSCTWGIFSFLHPKAAKVVQILKMYFVIEGNFSTQLCLPMLCFCNLLQFDKKSKFERGHVVQFFKYFFLIRIESVPLVYWSNFSCHYIKWWLSYSARACFTPENYFYFFWCTFSKHICSSCKIQRQTNKMLLAIYIDFPKFSLNFTLRRKHLLNLSSAEVRGQLLNPEVRLGHV